MTSTIGQGLPFGKVERSQGRTIGEGEFAVLASLTWTTRERNANREFMAGAGETDRELAAPVVVAKGRNLFAQQIKQIALWHGIPMVENRPLAHALYRAVEVGQSIPPKLYAVVAAILAAIFRSQERAGGAAGQAGR